MSFDNDAYQIIRQELEVDSSLEENGVELIEVITRRVNELLNSDPGLLFSYLYRLDVSEQKVQQIMHHSDTKNAPQALAELILLRQIERVKTKKKIKQRPIEGWEW